MTTDTIVAFNHYLQKIEDFSIKLPFSSFEIGFHDKTTGFYRGLAFGGIVFFSLLWVATGYETTILRLFTTELPIGVGIHWGTIVFTLGSFVICSKLLEMNGITKLRNALYSFILASGFLNGLFECVYTVLYDVLHHGEFWITAPFLYTDSGIFRLYPTYRNWYWLIFGFILLYVIKGHYWKIEGDSYFKLKWRNPLKNRYLLIFMMILMGFWLLWIFYPFPFYRVRGSLFPQYIYGFREHEEICPCIPENNTMTLVETGWRAVYMPNLGIRIVNELTKFSHFIFWTWVFIPVWRKQHDKN